MQSIARWGILGIVLTASMGTAVAAAAQAPGVQRTILQRQDVAGPGREAVMTRVEIAPGASAGQHTHPGQEMGYVLEGEGQLLIEGEAARMVKPGDSFVVPAGTKHNMRNDATKPLKLVAVYLVEKGKPLATPTP
jgi:quercetin dioxygenase-like cupin family protein